MELGVPGFVLWYGLRLALILSLWRTHRHLRVPFLRQVALGGLLVLFFQFFSLMTYVHTSALYHWFITGFILLLPQLDRPTLVNPEVYSSRRENRSRQRLLKGSNLRASQLRRHRSARPKRPAPRPIAAEGELLSAPRFPG
jgi:hypothetical protein